MSSASVGLRLRNLVLSLVAFASIVVNIAFVANTLPDPISRYTLLVYLLFLMGVVVLLEQTALRDEDVREALSANVYPSRVRTPMRVSFAPYVGVWLLWWFVSQLFFAVGEIHETGLVAQFLLAPLVLLALSFDVLFEPTPRRRAALTLLLLAVTLVALFFPTREWAPQRADAAWTVLRVVFYFFAVLGRDFISPANVYTNIGSDPPQPAHHSSQAVDVDLEANEALGRRRARVYLILDAYDRIDAETLRVREFVALTAWVLVVPVYLMLLIYPLSVAATIYVGRRDKARVVDVTEVQKVHPLPSAVSLPMPTATNTLVLPAASTQTSMSSFTGTGDQLPTRLVVPRRPQRAAQSPATPVAAAAVPSSVDTVTLPSTDGPAAAPAIVVKRTTF